MKNNHVRDNLLQIYKSMELELYITIYKLPSLVNLFYFLIDKIVFETYNVYFIMNFFFFSLDQYINEFFLV